MDEENPIPTTPLSRLLDREDSPGREPQGLSPTGEEAVNYDCAFCSDTVVYPVRTSRACPHIVAHVSCLEGKNAVVACTKMGCDVRVQSRAAIEIFTPTAVNRMVASVFGGYPVYYQTVEPDMPEGLQWTSDQLKFEPRVLAMQTWSSRVVRLVTAASFISIVAVAFAGGMDPIAESVFWISASVLLNIAIEMAPDTPLFFSRKDSTSLTELASGARVQFLTHAFSIATFAASYIAMMSVAHDKITLTANLSVTLGLILFSILLAVRKQRKLLRSIRSIHFRFKHLPKQEGYDSD